MQYLLDTHTLIWFIDNNEQLSEKAAKEIIHIENECFLSIASLWEIAIKCSIGKLTLKSDYHGLADLLVENNISILPVEFSHLQILLGLEHIHRDPFDRLIVSHAIAYDLTILTIYKNVVKYPVKCLW